MRPQLALSMVVISHNKTALITTFVPDGSEI